MTADLPITLEEVQRLYDRPAIVQPASNVALKARSQAVVDIGLSIGVKTGLSWQLGNIEAAVSKLARDLDLIYDFNPLLIQRRVIPSVITEARDLYKQDGDYAIRLSGAFYKIERQARFSSVPPNWREYLTFPKAAVDKNSMMSMLMPSTDDERAAWRAAVKNGWDQGVEQANIMLTQAMDRLNRDFGGMSRFHRFVVTGKISMPTIASEDISISRGEATMAVDETLLRITTLPEFNSKMSTWKGMGNSTPKPVAVPTVAITSTPAKSNGASTKSNGAPTKSNGASMQPATASEKNNE